MTNLPTAREIQTVGRMANRRGYRLETLGVVARDHWWLTRSENWVSREPGRTLAEVKAALEAMGDGQ